MASSLLPTVTLCDLRQLLSLSGPSSLPVEDLLAPTLCEPSLLSSWWFASLSPTVSQKEAPGVSPLPDLQPRLCLMALTAPTLPLTTLPPNAKRRAQGRPQHGEQTVVSYPWLFLLLNVQTRPNLGFAWEASWGLLGAPSPVLHLLSRGSPYGVLATMDGSYWPTWSHNSAGSARVAGAAEGEGRKEEECSCRGGGTEGECWGFSTPRSSVPPLGRDS